MWYQRITPQNSTAEGAPQLNYEIQNYGIPDHRSWHNIQSRGQNSNQQEKLTRIKKKGILGPSLTLQMLARVPQFPAPSTGPMLLLPCFCRSFCCFCRSCRCCCSCCRCRRWSAPVVVALRRHSPSNSYVHTLCRIYG